MKRLNLIIILLAPLLMLGCGGKKDNPTPVGPSPTAATLTTPAQNSVCVTGTVINSTQSNISFVWAASSNTDSYDLTIENLLTATSTTQNYATNQATVTLLQNTPYSWFVTSKSASSPTSSQSATWKFYNSGTGVVSYAPFPATIVSPVFAQSVTASNGAVNLTWTGGSVSTGAVLTYNVYFGTNSNPVLLKSGITDSFLNAVAVTSKTTYFWKVITTDILGNTSDSGLYQFSVN